jgi:predicted DNA-binding antitoxin AbrB/MazE fold protein
MIFMAHWAYGTGVLKGMKQIHLGEGAAAGLGIQIDDKSRD